MEMNVQALYDAGKRPERSRAGNLQLRDGNRRLLLSRPGKTTRAGKAYERISGGPLGREFAPAQQPVRRNNVEYLPIGGKDRVIRTWDAATNEWRYTALGKRYLNQRERVSYVAQAPALFKGKRSNGNTYERSGLWSIVNPIHLHPGLTEDQVAERVKAAVQEQFPDGLFTEYSGEEIRFDPEGQWRISMLQTTPDEAGGTPSTEVVERPLGTAPSVSGLIHPEAIVAAAWEDHGDRLCVPRQLASLLCEPLEDITAEFDTLLDGTSWHEVGVTSTQIFAFAKSRGLSACCIHNAKVLETLPGTGRPLCWAVHEHHCLGIRHWFSHSHTFMQSNPNK